MDLNMTKPTASGRVHGVCGAQIGAAGGVLGTEADQWMIINQNNVSRPKMDVI